LEKQNKMENKSLYDRLTKLVNATFGTTGPGATYKSGQKVNILVKTDNLVEVKYVSLVTFTSDKNLDSLMHKFRNEGYSLIEATFKKIIKEFEKENKGKTLSFTLNTNTATENVEYAHYNIYNSTRRAFYKLSCLAEIKEKNG